MKVKILIALKSFEAKQLSSSGSSLLPQTSVETSVPIWEDTLLKVEKGAGGAWPWVPKERADECQLVSIALPLKESNYTVLRSPHIDKKSRDQFALKVHKQLIILRTEIKQIRKKLFNFKFHEMPGVQMKVIFQTKTRLTQRNT